MVFLQKQKKELHSYSPLYEAQAKNHDCLPFFRIEDLRIRRTKRHKLIDIMTIAVLLATGNSKLQFVNALIALGTVDWSRIILFHLDEYLGLTANYSASLQCYM